MRKITFKAFSLVELLVVITIMAIIGIVVVSLNDGYKEKTYNTKVVTDLATIESALIRYKQENGYVPSPEGNLKYFTNDGSYAHDENDAYGFHGFITETTIPKRYINVLPRDPRSNQYYSYGKTLAGGFFEVSGILSNREKYESSVRGNFEGKDPLYNLIREYNGPEFVYDKSTKNFPYNPEEMLVSARISSFTGNLLINNKSYTKAEVSNMYLKPGDNIKLLSGSLATIYYSDGSYSELGDGVTPLELTLSVMKYKKDNNLFTRVRLALNFGTILTKASKMSSESNFDLYTTDIEASVRGTIFQIIRIPGENKTTVKVIKGSIFLNSINIASYDVLLEILKRDEEISPKFPIISPIPNDTEIFLVNGHQESILKEGGEITIIGGNSVPLTTTTCDPINEHMEASGCKQNTEICDIVDTGGLKIGEGTRIWNITRGNCNATSCILPYIIDGNTCINNSHNCGVNEVWDGTSCISQTKTVLCTGLPTNAVWTLVDNITQTWNAGNYLPSNIGFFNSSPVSNSCGYKCKNNYTWNQVTKLCNPNSQTTDCVGSNPYNSIKITGNKFTQTYNGSIFIPVSKSWGYNQTECGFACDTNNGYVWNGSSCILNTTTRTVNCGGSNPQNSYKTTGNTYTQTCVGTNCNPNLNWGYNKGICGFICNNSYERKNNSCTLIITTRTANCGGSNPQNSYKTTGNTYTQTCVGTNCNPNLNWGYNKGICGFICNGGYSRKNGSCESNTVSGHGCEQCPNGFYKSGRFGSCTKPSGSRFIYTCSGLSNATPCKIEDNKWWNCPESGAIPQSWTGNK